MKFSVSQKPGKTHVKLSGDLREGLEHVFADLRDRIPNGPVHIECSEVHRINSAGVAIWLPFIRELSDRCDITFDHCSTVIVDYANILRGFLGKGRVLSFHAPFACSQCGHASEQLFDAAIVRASKVFPKVICTKCSGELEPEVDTDDFLVFLQHS